MRMLKDSISTLISALMPEEITENSQQTDQGAYDYFQCFIVNTKLSKSQLVRSGSTSAAGLLCVCLEHAFSSDWPFLLV